MISQVEFMGIIFGISMLTLPFLFVYGAKHGMKRLKKIHLPKGRMPHPALILVGLILAVIGFQLFVPESINYGNWVGWSWIVFWWMWVFPFFFLKLYDWITVRKARGSSGGGSIWLRYLGIIILASMIAILFIFFIIWLIGRLLALQIR